ncbi:MAG: TrmH family RNA methyltransferase [Bacteroidia bacterium]|nr:TrmH family RNA methyltransferase [Bacteroidia bacterium]
MQLTHHTSKFKKRSFPIILVCDHVSNAPNIGSLFRTADAFGIEKLILCGDHISLGRRMTKTSRATEKTVPFELQNDSLHAVTKLRASNYRIIALEVTSNSQALHQFDLNNSQPIALIIGDENFGIRKELLELSDAVVHVEMFGKNSSMNVVQAASITLYEFTRQFL